jgi:scyllo-inosose 3-dehydrogenase
MRAILLEADWAPRRELTTLQTKERKAAGCDVWQHPRFRAEVLAEPEPAPDEVIVRVGACGVCGSDTHCFETDSEGYVLFSGPVSLPVVPGHEYAGEVVAVGSAVRSLRVGQLVAAEGMLNCGICEACRQGHPNQCPHLEMVGFSAPGAYAEFIAVKERFCWSLDGLAERVGSTAAVELGALVEPIACSYNGIWGTGPGMRPGAHVVVYGAGPIGLGAVALARCAGAASITVVEPGAGRRAVALTLGADTALDVNEDIVAHVRERTRGWGADLQIECAGAAKQTMAHIEQLFAPGGSMVYLGRTGERAPVMLDALVTGAASISGSRGHVGAGCFPNVIRLLEAGRLDVAPMITARRPFSEFHAALEQSCERTDGKILLTYGR